MPLNNRGLRLSQQFLDRLRVYALLEPLNPFRLGGQEGLALLDALLFGLEVGHHVVSLPDFVL